MKVSEFTSTKDVVAVIFMEVKEHYICSLTIVRDGKVINSNVIKEGRLVVTLDIQKDDTLIFTPHSYKNKLINIRLPFFHSNYGNMEVVQLSGINNLTPRIEEILKKKTNINAVTTELMFDKGMHVTFETTGSKSGLADIFLIRGEESIHLSRIKVGSMKSMYYLKEQDYQDGDKIQISHDRNVTVAW